MADPCADPDPNAPPVFLLGLTMAGAISAGAYNAGAFDFLIEALEAWEQRKRKLRDDGTRREDWDVPSHDVVIPVMSGASAGGITGALGLVALADQASPRRLAVPGVGNVTTTLPRLYQAWVQLPCLVSGSGGNDLLGTADLAELAPGQAASALLDTSILWEIAERSLSGIAVFAPPRPYLGAQLDLFLTHTNLRGVPYAIGFAGADPEDGYEMTTHADRAHYRVAGIGSHAAFASRWASGDPARGISVATLPTGRGLPSHWARYAVDVLASGAFPLGLAARAIGPGPTLADYRERSWPMDCGGAPGAGTAFRLAPKFPPAMADDPARTLDYVAVDGGLINNEPFELARWTLMRTPPTGNARDSRCVDRAVLMIDPFPEAAEYDVLGKLDGALTTVIRRILPALKDQVRFKPADAAAALDETIYSRFLMTPRRRDAAGALQPHPLACGLLGGFGGFLSEAFRAHDYQLGRNNAYRFLKNHFALPMDNLVLARGYDGNAAPLGRFILQDQGRTFRQIIPVLPPEPEIPSWPRVDRGTVETMVARAVARADAVFANLAATVRSRLMRVAAKAGWRLLARSRAEIFIRWTVLQDLIRRDQLQETWMTGKLQKQRLVLSALADPAYDFRTAAGIAAQHGLGADEVDRVLAELRALHPGLIWEGPRAADDAQSFTFEERKPGFLGRLPGVAQARDWFTAPTIG
jgi:hypothetical protein